MKYDFLIHHSIHNYIKNGTNSDEVRSEEYRLKMIKSTFYAFQRFYLMIFYLSKKEQV